MEDPGLAKAKYMFEEFLRSMEVNEDGTPRFPDEYSKYSDENETQGEPEG